MELDWVTKDFKNARIPPFLSPFNKNYLDLFNEEEFSELSKNVYEVLCEIQMFNRRISLQKHWKTSHVSSYLLTAQNFNKFT